MSPGSKGREGNGHSEKGLPANIDAEKFILGSLLLDGARFVEIASVLREEDFALEKHRRMFKRMSELHGRGENIDHVTVANELLRRNELESVDGLSYLVSLDDGLPHIANLDSYVRIIRDKAALRRIALTAQHLMNRALLAEESPDVILDSAEEALRYLGEGTSAKAMSVGDIVSIRTYAAQKIDWLLHTMIAAGTVTLITGDSGSGKSSLISAICYAISRGDQFAGLRTQQRPVVYLDRENPLPIVVERFDRLGLDDSADFRYWGGWCPSEPPTPSSPTMAQWVKSCEVKPLIVVDSFGAFGDGTDENSATEVRRWMDGPRRLADAGASLVVLHNAGKGESTRDYRGSSAFKDAIDVGYCVVNLSPDPSRLSKLRLKAFKARFAVAPEIVFHYVDDEFRTDSRPAAQTAILTLRDLLAANPDIGSREFEAKATQKGLKRTNVRNFIRNGIVEGTIRVERGAKNEQHHTWIGSSSADDMTDNS